MSQLAARQFQTENKDVNNLWHWPNTLTVLQIMGVQVGTWVTLTDIVIR